MNSISTIGVLVVAVGLWGGCSGVAKDNAHVVAEPPTIRQPLKPLEANGETVADEPSGHVDTEQLPDEARLELRRQRWRNAMERLSAEPVDGPWAAEVAAAIERCLSRRLKSEERALLSKVACHTQRCAVEIDATSDEFRAVTTALRYRVSMDLRGEGHATSLSFMSDPDQTGDKTRGYFFFSSVRN